MGIFSVEEIEELAAVKSEFCVSIFIPTHRFGEEVNNGLDRIRFKTEIENVQNQLLKKGYQERFIVTFLDPALKLYNDVLAWRHMQEGLALFIGENFYKQVSYPIRFKTESFIAKDFIITPLLPLLVQNGAFFILNLSQKLIKFYKATPLSIEQIDLENTEVPVRMEDYMQYFEFQKPTPGGTQNTGRNSSVQGNQFNGDRTGKDKEDLYVWEYFKRVNSGITAILKESDAPLVLVGVRSVVAIYQEANTYKHLSDETVSGNFEQAHQDEIHKRAWDIVKKEFEQPLKKRLDSYNAWAGTGKTSYAIEDIYVAAVAGRVDTLMLFTDKHIWAEVDDKGIIEIHEEQQEKDTDLFNSIAVQTILNGGVVIPVTRETMPEKDKEVNLAAVYRY